MSKTSSGFLAVLFLIVLSACQKEDLSPSAITDADAADAQISLAGATKLVLQPGPGIGQDAMIDYRTYDNSADSNRDYPHELNMYTWTVYGRLIYARSYLKFSELSALPANAKVLYAKLYMYGVDTSGWTPQGNSVYKHSPILIYAKNNDCYVQRVTGGDWDESTITWNNAPTATIADEAVIPRSTSKWNYNAGVDVTGMVNKMVSQQKNYGFRMMLTDEEVYRSMIFSTSESPDPAKRPKLVVYYK